MKAVYKVISYLAHPIFVPTLFFLVCIQLLPYEFVGIDPFKLKLKLFGVFWFTAFFPAFGVFLLWRLKFIQSIYIETSKERIIPYFISMFFYWWMYYLSKNFTDQPAILKSFYFGIFISTALGVVANNYLKVSLHGMAWGGLLTALVCLWYHYNLNISGIIIVTAFLTALVCYARLQLKSHSDKEVYVGIILGLFCQAFGYWFVFK